MVLREPPPVDPAHPTRTVHGYVDWAERAIRIAPTLRRTAAWLTLRHEWMHAVCCDAGIDLPVAKEEALCNAVALALVAEMRHTPRLS